MTIERTSDLELVRRVVTDPAIYSRLTDDFSPSAADFHPIANEGVWYCLVRDGAELLGLFMLVWHSPVMVEIHTCLLPAAWGERAAAAAAEMGAWIWSETRAARIITAVPEYNRLALRFARAAGMREYGRNPHCYQKRGRLHGVILLGLSRPEKESKLCQQQ